MRSYARVSPRFWTGEFGRSIRSEPEAQIVSLYVMTCPHANMIGLFHLPIAYICADTGLCSEGASMGLRRGIDGAFLRYDESTERVWIVEHLRHELGEPPKATDKRIPKVIQILENHRCSRLYGEFIERYGESLGLVDGSPSDGPSMPLRRGYVPVPVPVREEKEKKRDYPKDFEQFWSVYPKKRSKADALKAWKQTRGDRPPLPDLLSRLEAFRRSKDWTKHSGEFVPYPATWLRAGGWDDELSVEVPKQAYNPRG